MAGIYIHIPFCRQLCHYCDFHKSISLEHMDEMLSCLQKELCLRREYLGESPIKTLYIGGGTPSLLSVGKISDLLDKVLTNYPVLPDAEITFEANPDDITPDYLKCLKNTPINRLSIGSQSFCDTDLKLLHRRHRAAQAIEAVNGAAKAGFHNISLDLIYGIPGMDRDTWDKNLEIAFSLPIQHISAYHLTIEPKTTFQKWVKKGKIILPDEGESIGQFELLLEKSKKYGFVQYEISNFCKEGYDSQHNSNYWKQAPYLGIGPSAHSFNGYSRQWNVSHNALYMEGIQQGKPVTESEILDTKTRYNDYILVSLRTIWGTNLTYIEENFGKEIKDYCENNAKKFMDWGKITLNNGVMVLTDSGKQVADNIISELFIV